MLKGLKNKKGGDKLAYIKKIATDIMNYRGVSRSLFLKCEVKKNVFIVKMCFPRRLNETSGGDTSFETEEAILREFKATIIDGNVSPCLLEILDSGRIKDLLKVCKSKQECIKLVTRGNTDSIADEIDIEICKFASLIRANLADNYISYIALEICDITLQQFLQRKQNYSPIIVEIIRSILFQIVYTIYAINKIFPGFRHYDLHAQNVMLLFQEQYEFNIRDIKYMRFYVGDKVANVPYFGVIAKIIDFGYSVLPEINVRSKASEDKRIMHARHNNDLLFLLHNVYYAVQGNSTNGPVTKILEQIDPTKAHIEYFYDQMEELGSKIPTYEQMATCVAFSSYFDANIANKAVWGDYDGIKKYTKHK